MEEQEHDGPSRCWLCGRFGVRHRTTYGVLSRTCAVLGSENSCTVCTLGEGGWTCRRCGVGWFTMSDDDWSKRQMNRVNELKGILGRYRMIEDGYVDHAKVDLPSPA